MPLALRIGRSRSIWEDGTTAEIAKKEFRGKSEGSYDERPSVYLVESDELSRAVAEHVTQVNPPVQKHADELDLTGLGPTESRPAQRFFAFTNARHAEVVLSGQAAVLALVQRLLADPKRRQRRSSQAVEAYIIGQLSQNDAEWGAFMSARVEWQKELKKWLKPRDV